MAKKRIVVVENDSSILNILTYILENEGYEYKSLGSVDGVIDLVQQYKPHAILLDICVPGIIGTETCKKIKNIEGLRDIPLIVLTTQPIITATITEICADEVIDKPFDIEDLIRVVQKQVSN